MKKKVLDNFAVNVVLKDKDGIIGMKKSDVIIRIVNYMELK